MVNKSSLWSMVFIVQIIVGLGVSSNASADEYAEIGIVRANNTVELFKKRFVLDMGNAVTATEISTTIADGFLLVFRKGYSDSNCLQDSLQISNNNGLISVANKAKPGDILSVSARSRWTITRCTDVTCSDHVTAVGFPPHAVYARCETPSSITAPCACRFPESAGGELVPVINACKSNVTQVPVDDLSTWVHAQYIQYK